MSPVNDLQKRVLEELGVDVWQLRQSISADDAVSLPAEASTEPVDNFWNVLQDEVQSCQRCALSRSRSQTVFGSGNPQADLMLIGEAPGAEEDRQGLPFVGKAGSLLNAMLRAIGLQREQVYICNVLKCRPPNNRNPQVAEVDACASYLYAQIEYIKPKLILALGRFAAHSLLKTEQPIYKMREKQTVLPGANIPVVVSYHPASLLRNPADKALAWQDLCKVQQLLETTTGD